MRILLSRFRDRWDRGYCWLVHSWKQWVLIRPPAETIVCTAYWRCLTCDRAAPGWYTP